MEDDLLTLTQAAKRLGVTEAVVRRLEKRGDLVPHTIEYRGKQRRPLFWGSDVATLRSRREGERSGVRSGAPALN